ncbi:MAG: hypothetical protein ACRDHN_18585, partial [Thermomicrobiales bacterium]
GGCRPVGMSRIVPLTVDCAVRHPPIRRSKRSPVCFLICSVRFRTGRARETYTCRVTSMGMAIFAIVQSIVPPDSGAVAIDRAPGE